MKNNHIWVHDNCNEFMRVRNTKPREIKMQREQVRFITGAFVVHCKDEMSKNGVASGTGYVLIPEKNKDGWINKYLGHIHLEQEDIAGHCLKPSLDQPSEIAKHDPNRPKFD